MHWQTKDGTLLDIEEMETKHLVNAMAFIKKNGYSITEEMGFCDEKGKPIAYDEVTKDLSMAYLAMKLELIKREVKAMEGQ